MPEARPITDTSTLQPGQSIKVKAGKSAMDATVLEVSKDGVRVQLASGMAMIVRSDPADLREAGESDRRV